MTSENIEKKGEIKSLSPAFYRWMYGVFLLLSV